MRVAGSGQPARDGAEGSSGLEGVAGKSGLQVGLPADVFPAQKVLQQEASVAANKKRLQLTLM